MNELTATLTSIKLKEVKTEILAAQKDTFDEMRKQYPSMTLSDIQSVATFMQIFEEKYLT